MAVVVESVGTGQQSSDTTSLTITAPSGIVNGNLLLAIVARDPANAGDVAISGFSLLTPDFAAQGGDRMTQMLIKTASSESGNYSATWTGNQKAVGAILRISGHHTLSPVVALVTGYNDGQYFVCPGVSVPAATLLVQGFGADNSLTPYAKWDGPSSTERVNLTSGGSPGSCGLFVHSHVQSTAGYGAQFGANQASVDDAFAFTLGIRDAGDTSALFEAGLHAIEQGIVA